MIFRLLGIYLTLGLILGVWYYTDERLRHDTASTWLVVQTVVLVVCWLLIAPLAIALLFYRALSTTETEP